MPPIDLHWGEEARAAREAGRPLVALESTLIAHGLPWPSNLETARQSEVAVRAGAKSILDLPATLEVLETLGVPVVGYGTDTFPAFYLTSSGLPVSARADTPAAVAALARAHWHLGGQGILLAQPVAPGEA